LAELRFIASPGSPDLEDDVVHAVVRDVSAKGMKLRLHIDVPLNAQIEVRYRALTPSALAPGETFVHRGRVAWTQTSTEGVVVTHQVGVQLTQVDATRQEIWDGFLTHGAGIRGSPVFSTN
jgi:hypothetical protein